MSGTREILPLPPIQKPSNLTIEELMSRNNEIINEVLNHPTARLIRSSLTNGPGTLSDILKYINGTLNNTEIQKSDLLKWLDLLSHPEMLYKGRNLLPLRGHVFHRILHGLWACCNSSCKEKKGTELDHPEWKFGLVYMQQRLKCDCGAPVYELVSCSDCNAEHLLVTHAGDKYSQSVQIRPNEFALDATTEENEEDEEDQIDILGPANELAIGTMIVNGTSSKKCIDGDGVIEGADGMKIDVVITNSTRYCTQCDFHGTARVEVFRRCHLGVPFYSSIIVPTLLEHLPDGQTEPLRRPFYGRSLITFSDSRQGTARMAVKLQQDAERLRLRGLIVETIYGNYNESDLIKIDQEIEDIKAAMKHITGLKSILDSKLQEREQKINFTVSWKELVDKLRHVPDIKDHMFSYYKELSPEIFNTTDGLNDLIRCLLTANFSTRPKRANSTETLGLVEIYYEGLDKIKYAPIIWTDAGLSVVDWKRFLKLCLDFQVRAGIYLNIDPRHINWLGRRFRPKYLIPPDAPTTERLYRRWPTYRSGIRPNRLIRILARLLNIELAIVNRKQKDLLNELMHHAWKDLTHGTEILSKQGNGFHLTFEKFLFRKPRETWFCPITLKVLDNVIKGISPYLPVQGNLSFI